jgi:hypothetical protein
MYIIVLPNLMQNWLPEDKLACTGSEGSSYDVDAAEDGGEEINRLKVCIRYL